MVANAASTCASVPAGTTNSGWATDCAVAFTPSICCGVDPVFGLTRNAIKPGFGITSRRRPKRFGPSSVVKALTPVAFPPGQLRLPTSPSWTGSSPTPKTMGIVVVAALTANADDRLVQQRRQPTNQIGSQQRQALLAP